MYSPKTIYTTIALNTILNYLKVGLNNDLRYKEEREKLTKIKRGCFVSIHKLDGSLRGCMGTIEPCEKDLAAEISRNAISAAFNDYRFPSLSAKELDEIEISVDVLTEPEEIFDFADLDPLIYGVIVTDGKSHRAVLLPSIPTIDKVEKQIKIVKEKAGLSKFPDSDLKFFRFTSTRYH